MALAGTSRQSPSFDDIPNSSGIALHFSQKETPFLARLACREWKGSWRVDRFCPEGIHLANIFGTFIDDVESVGRYWVAVLAGEEREAMKRVHAD